MSSKEEHCGAASDRHKARALTDRDRDVFLTSLDEEAATNKALDSAFEAHAILVDQTEFHLPPAQWEAFCKRLDAPAKVIPVLRDLFSEPE